MAELGHSHISLGKRKLQFRLSVSLSISLPHCQFLRLTVEMGTKNVLKWNRALSILTL